MICIARIFGAPVNVPAGNAATSASSRSRSGRQSALDARDEMHHVRVALDGHVLGHANAADLRDPADVVAAEIHEHDVLGPLLLIATQLLGKPPVLLMASAPRRRVPAIGWVSIWRPSTRTSISGEAPTMASRPEADEEHVGRRIDVPERAIDVERRRGRRRPRTAATARPGRFRRRRCPPGFSRTDASNASRVWSARMLETLEARRAAATDCARARARGTPPSRTRSRTAPRDPRPSASRALAIARIRCLTWSNARIVSKTMNAAWSRSSGGLSSATAGSNHSAAS